MTSFKSYDVVRRVASEIVSFNPVSPMAVFQVYASVVRCCATQYQIAQDINFRLGGRIDAVIEVLIQQVVFNYRV